LQVGAVLGNAVEPEHIGQIVQRPPVRRQILAVELYGLGGLWGDRCWEERRMTDAGEIIVERNLMVPTRDGVMLATDSAGQTVISGAP